MTGYVVILRSVVVGSFACVECDSQSCNCIMLAMAHARESGNGTEVRRVRDHVLLAVVRKASGSGADPAEYLGSKYNGPRKRRCFDFLGAA